MIFSHERYDQLIADTFKKIVELGQKKGGEYAGDTDRLANFRRNADQTDVPPETVWSIYYNKHHDAVMQYIKDLKNGVQRPRMESISGRIDDMIVYLLLFKCFVMERENPDETPNKEPRLYCLDPECPLKYKPHGHPH